MEGVLSRREVGARAKRAPGITAGVSSSLRGRWREGRAAPGAARSESEGTGRCASGWEVGDYAAIGSAVMSSRVARRFTSKPNFATSTSRAFQRTSAKAA